MLKKTKISQNLNFLFHFIYEQYPTQVINILVLLWFLLFVSHWTYWSTIKNSKKIYIIYHFFLPTLMVISCFCIFFVFEKPCFAWAVVLKSRNYFCWKHVFAIKTERKKHKNSNFCVFEHFIDFVSTTKERFFSLFFDRFQDFHFWVFLLSACSQRLWTYKKRIFSHEIH